MIEHFVIWEQCVICVNFDFFDFNACNYCTSYYYEVIYFFTTKNYFFIRCDYTMFVFNYKIYAVKKLIIIYVI